MKVENIKTEIFKLYQLDYMFVVEFFQKARNTFSVDATPSKSMGCTIAIQGLIS